MLIATCPKDPSHETFIVSAHVVQEWLVDKNGEFKKSLNECTDITHHPAVDDIWQCSQCGAEAVVRNGA